MASRQSDNPQTWTVAQLTETLEALIESDGRRCTMCDDYQKELVRVALVSNNKRLDSMNGFRADLADQSARMMTRAETSVIHQAIIDKADEAARW
jgi:hypothetical protein